MRQRRTQRGLGLPILGDRLYGSGPSEASAPEPEDTALDDWTRPLQLLATTLELPDPVTGVVRQEWDDAAGRPPSTNATK